MLFYSISCQTSGDGVTGMLHHPHGLWRGGGGRRRVGGKCELVGRGWAGEHGRARRGALVHRAARAHRQADRVQFVQQSLDVDHVQLTDDQPVQYQQLVAHLQT